jgi:rod shape-determining protein MreC
VGFLVLAAFALLTVSFRSSALDGVEGFGASVLRPFELGANRVARPFRDATGYTRGLFDAKAENQKLRRANEALRREYANLLGAAQRNVQLQKLLNYSGAPTFPHDFTSVAAQVITNPTAFDQSITIAAGSHEGIKVQDVVVTNEGLVGQVTKVTSKVSRVMLITAASSSVRAVDELHDHAIGQLDPGSGQGSLVLDDVDKSTTVKDGDVIVTAGSPADGKLPSLFPRGIVIGTVTSAGQNDTDIYWQIQVTPYANLGSLQTVLVLIPKPAAKSKP